MNFPSKVLLWKIKYDKISSRMPLTARKLDIVSSKVLIQCTVCDAVLYRGPVGFPYV